METAENYVDSKREKIERDLKKLISQKSISKTGEGMEECVKLISELCLDYGFETSEILRGDGHPAVIAENMVDDGKPTVIFYGHYDVQPAESSEWNGDPFHPTVEEEGKNRRIYGRGAGDNKGQFFAHICAVDALTAAEELDLNVILLLEGEEETGSPSLPGILAQRDSLKKADLLVCADGSMEQGNVPVIEKGCRGMLYLEVRLKTGERNLHSGEYGGIERNAAYEISRLISSLKDNDGVVRIEGFYDNFLEPSEEDVRDIRRIEDHRGFEKSGSGGPDSGLEAKYLYPNLNIAGVQSGLPGKGTETIIPCEAEASIGIRLVAEQKSREILEKTRKHIRENLPDEVEFEVNELGSVNPYSSEIGECVVERLEKAIEHSQDRKPLIKPVSSSTLPFYVLASDLDIECVKIPYANEDQNNHSPGENLQLERLYRGVVTSAFILKELAKTPEHKLKTSQGKV